MSFLVTYELKGHAVYVMDTPWLIEGVHGVALLLPQQLLETLSDEEALNTIHWFCAHAKEIENDCMNSLDEDQSRNERPQKAGNKAGWVYVLRAGPYYKIGKTKNVSKRIKQISPKIPLKTSLLYKIRAVDMNAMEDQLHARYEKYRVKGEWFRLPQKALDELRVLARASNKEAIYV